MGSHIRIGLAKLVTHHGFASGIAIGVLVMSASVLIPDWCVRVQGLSGTGRPRHLHSALPWT